MYRVLIADDEQLERQAVKFILQKRLDFEIDLVGEACNGAKAVELAQKFEPEIIFMDIKMPDLDGLESTRIIKNMCPDVKIIILTAFDEFSYAQEALKLGALDYLLKPARPSQIVSIMHKAVSQLKHKEKTRSKDTKLGAEIKNIMPYLEMALVYNLIFGNVNSLPQIEGLEHIRSMVSKPSFIMTAQINELWKLSASGNTKSLQFFYGDVLGFIKSSASQEEGFLAAAPMDRDKVVLLFGEPNNGKPAKDYSIQVAKRIHQKVRKKLNVDLDIAVGNSYYDVSDLHKSYWETVNILTCAFLTGDKQVIHTDDLETFDYKQQSYPYTKEKILIEKVKLGDEKTVCKIAKEFFEHWFDDEGMYNPIIAKHHMIELLAVLGRGAVEGGLEPESVFKFNFDQMRNLMNLNSVKELEVWMEQVLIDLVKKVNNCTESYKLKIINKGIKFINDNLKDVTLEKVSEHVHVSPYYFSRLFKAKKGSTFIDYVTNLRMNKAKQLIKTTNDSIVLIAKQIGYAEPGYFSKVFKKKFGITPNEYRKKQKHYSTITC